MREDGRHVNALIIAFPAVLCEWEASRGIAATDRKRERESGREKRERMPSGTTTTTTTTAGMMVSKRVDFRLAGSGKGRGRTDMGQETRSP